MIVGGGFYGAAIAIYLVKQRQFKKVTLIEREKKLLSRASYNNQARIHNGYHYPRSFTTAYRSRVNYPKFIKEWPASVSNDFLKLYAIARRNSKVTSKQFERFCRAIGAKIERASPSLVSLFDPKLIEDVFVVDECAFDSTKLATWAIEELSDCGVEIILESSVTKILKGVGMPLQAIVSSRDMDYSISSSYVFNCTYSGLNQFEGDFSPSRNALKHEIAEMALISMPPELRTFGVTVMDGPFFSTMPFPARELHTLSHVRYTPHVNWDDIKGDDPYRRLEVYEQQTRVERMLRDASRYMPPLRKARYLESLFEVKTILQKNEADDGRPILFERHIDLPGFYSILGGKIDNIYDVLEKLDHEIF